LKGFRMADLLLDCFAGWLLTWLAGWLVAVAHGWLAQALWLGAWLLCHLPAGVLVSTPLLKLFNPSELVCPSHLDLQDGRQRRETH
jgi:hypothetical protein